MKIKLPPKPAPEPKKVESRIVYEYPPPGTLNYSQLAEWFKCRYRWDLARNRRISSRTGQRSLDLGSAVHFGMAAGLRVYASQKKLDLKAISKAADAAIVEWLEETVSQRGGVDQLSPEEQEEWATINQAFGICRKALEDMRLERFKVLQYKKSPLIEYPLRFAMPKGSGWEWFHITLDLVLQDLEVGGNWILDYKVRKQYTQVEAEEVNIQFPIYQHALAKHGIETLGSIMYQVKAQQPSEPSVNKNGTMSRARIATTWEVYKAALIREKLDPRDYLEMQAKLDVEFHRETREPRNEAQVEWIWHDIVLPAAIAMAKDMPNVIRTGMYNGVITCNGCWARRFCLGELRNEDTDFLLQTDYIDQKNPKERIIMKPEDVILKD